jgi:hypothetical protein
MPQRDRSRFPHRWRPLLENLESRLVPSLLVNGDFETGFDTGDFPGWTQSGNRSQAGIFPGNAHGGQFAAHLGTAPHTEGEAFLAQTFTTIPGDSYTLNYWLEHSFDGGDNSFRAMIDGVDIPGSVLISAGRFSYTQYTFTFTAGPSGTTELKFGVLDRPSEFGLDDVSVDPGNHVVPVVVSNSLSSLFIDETVDHGHIVFNTAVNPDSPPPADEFSLQDPSGNPVNITSMTAADSTNTVFDVTFDPQSAGGTYGVTIGPNIRDFDGNPMTAPFSSQFTIVVGSLLVNGGFETGDFTGWTQSGDPNAAVSSFAPVHSGRFAAAFGPNDRYSFISQTVPTTPGQTYQLSFWLYHTYNQGTNEFAVVIGGNVVDNEASVSFPYTQFAYTYTATDTSTTIEFGAVELGDSFYLDDMVFQPIDSARAPHGGSGSRMAGTMTGSSALTGPPGAVHVTSSDAQAVLLADSAVTAADAGVNPFLLTSATPGDQARTVTDTAEATRIGRPTVPRTSEAAAPAGRMVQNATDALFARSHRNQTAIPSAAWEVEGLGLGSGLAALQSP